jgi:hypothetical protein
MLIAAATRYISLRQTLGFRLRELSLNLNAFARYAAGRGETHIRIATAVAWATAGCSLHSRYVRLRDVARFARFLHTEDPAHEVPMIPLHAPVRRRLPYIYTPKEIVQILEASHRLRETYPLRRQVYGTLLGPDRSHWPSHLRGPQPPVPGCAARRCFADSSHQVR